MYAQVYIYTHIVITIYILICDYKRHNLLTFLSTFKCPKSKGYLTVELSHTSGACLDDFRFEVVKEIKRPSIDQK